MRHLKEATKISLLWQDHGPNFYPICLQTIVDEIINKSSAGDTLKLREVSYENIEGAMIKSNDGNGQFVASVNENISNSGRKRFTLAHEIGHFICHRKLDRAFQCSREMINDFYNDQIEKEANQFASQLLLPPNELRKFDEMPWTIETLKKISEHFDVSLQAAGLKFPRVSSKKVGFVVSRDDMVCWGSVKDLLYREGYFFRGGDEISEGSSAFEGASNPSKLEQTIVTSNLWRHEGACREESMIGFDEHIYTCIEFL